MTPRPETSATLFCRVSSANQSHYSHEAQQRLGEEYAARHGLTVTRVFRVTETASKKLKRQRWEEYLDYARRGPEKHVLVASVDRALRNYADLPEVAELRSKHGKTVHFFLEGLTLDGAHASSTDLRLGIQAAVAVYYAGELAEKVRRGVNTKALKGEWPNRACFGYINEKRRLVVDPDKAPWVRRVKELSARAQYSIDKIVQMLLVESGRRFHRNLVERIIRNPLYAGRYEWPRGSGNWVQGVHEPIVSWDLHEAAIAGLERRNLPRYRKHLFTFAGMIRCGCCPEGRAVVFELRKNRYVYAHCTGYRRSKAGERGRMCPDAEFVPLGVIDAQVEEALSSVHISYDLADKIYSALAAGAGAAQTEAEAKAAVIRGQLKRLSGREAQAYADKLDGKIDEQFWSAQKKTWGDERVRLEEALRRLESSAPSAALAKAREVLKLAKDIVPIYKFADVDEKRRILNLACSNWTLSGKKLNYQMQKPFAGIREGLRNGRWWEVRDAIQTWAASQPLVLSR